jgi:hypothetical protein
VSTIKVDTVQKLNGSVPKASDLGLNVTGSVLQVQSSILTTHFTFTTTSFADITGLTVNITPSSSNSKILVTAHLGAVSGGGAHAQIFGFARDSTVIGQSTASVTTAGGIGRYTGGSGAADNFESMSFQVLDSPSTTSQVTYKLQGKTTGSTTYIGRWGSDDSQFGFSSSITVMEIAG